MLLFLKQFSKQFIVVGPCLYNKYKLLKKGLIKFSPVQQIQLFKNGRVQTLPEPNWFVLDFIQVLLGKGFYQRHYMTFDNKNNLIAWKEMLFSLSYGGGLSLAWTQMWVYIISRFSI